LFEGIVQLLPIALGASALLGLAKGKEMATKVDTDTEYGSVGRQLNLAKINDKLKTN
jgi:hypothetical protein